MTKAKEKSVLVCTDCEEEVYMCFGCKEYFQNADEIICQEGNWSQIHYCESCRKSEDK